MDTWELLRWSLGILTGDNHNSRYTRATVSLRPPVLSLPIPPLSARSSSTSSLSSTLRPFAPRACAYVCLCLPPFPWPPLVASSPCRPRPRLPSWPDHPVASATAIPQLFSSFLALVAVAAVAGDFTCLPLPAVLYRGVPFFLRLSRLLRLVVHPSLPLSSVGRPASVSISRPMSHLPTYLSPSRPPFILEMGTGIHETKLMITTSKQRAARPTATCPAIHISHSSSRCPPSHPHRTVLRCSMRTPRVSLHPVSPVLPRFSFFSADSPLSR